MASAPSVEGRSPTTTRSSPVARALMASAVGRCGLPATSGVAPAAVATAASSDAGPGHQAVGRGVGGVLVRPDQARPARTAAGGPVERRRR